MKVAYRNLACAVVVCCTPSLALADDPQPARFPPRPAEVRQTTPAATAAGSPIDQTLRIGLVESPYGLPRGFIGVAALGTVTSSKDSGTPTDGGVLVSGAPIERLTLGAYLNKDTQGNFAPMIGGHVRWLGSLDRGFAFGSLAQYKAEGFSEWGGELEVGLTFGARLRRWSLDSNVIAGFGLEEKDAGEADAECKLRTGFDITEGLRLGLAGQGRQRLAGDRKLAGDKTWDAKGGPQIALSWHQFVASATAGPTTQYVAEGVGFFAMLGVGGISPL